LFIERQSARRCRKVQRCAFNAINSMPLPLLLPLLRHLYRRLSSSDRFSRSPQPSTATLQLLQR
jgi:hypothetical protein